MSEVSLNWLKCPWLLLVLAAGPSITPAQGAAATISVNFVGSGTTAMGSSETAGVVAKGQWNNATGAQSSSPLTLVDETGAFSGAAVSWTSDNTWAMSIPDLAGNNRMMRGYLDTGAGNPTTVSVSGLAAGTYNVYVYADGDNAGFSHTGIYQISGPGIAASSISATDAPNTNFNGTFVQATNSAGNYVVFSGITVTSGFTLTATPGAARAPVNAIQIVPAAGGSADFTISAAPASQTVTPGGSTSYGVSIGALSGFAGTVNLSASGLPSGATAAFSPASITASGSSTLTIATTGSTPPGSPTLTITGTSGALIHTATVTLAVNSTGSQPAISINFVGSGTTAMASSEIAGVVAKSQWNNAAGAQSSSPLTLVNETGGFSGASVSWTSDNTWAMSIPDVPGNNRMMRGYLDTGAGNPTTVSVSGLVAGTYNIYVYADGDNAGFSHTGIYQIGGPGVATSSISATDAPNTNFSGNFVQATNSAGNYVVFSGVTVTSGFTLTATPGAARAPVNAIQIVPAAGGSPDFTISAAPASQTVTPGGTTTYTVSIGALSGFSGTVNLAASGLPSGAAAAFSPSSITGSGSSTLTITTTGSTPPGSPTLTITGTSGALTHTATVTLAVSTTSSQPVISINFVGSGTTAMASSETAGVVAKSQWNNATGAQSGSPLSLVNETGTATGAAVSWSADNTWAISIPDVAGNNRMMRGYLDTGNRNPTTVSVTGLAAGTYSVYVYADGDNAGFTYTGNYQISGPGVTTSSISATDAANTNFSGSFVQAANSAGNYVVFTGVTITSGFTLTATPGVSRAPVNGIQIVPTSGGSPNFTISATPASRTVTAGGTTTYAVSIGAFSGFTGTVNLAASGLPGGATAAFSPTTVTGSGSSTMTITTTGSTPSGSPTLTITGTSGTLTRTATVTLVVGTGAPGSPVSDDFTSPALNTGVWTFVNPQNDGSFSLNGSSILLSVPAGISHDVWSNGDESVRIMQSVADADFEVEAKFSSAVDINTMYQEEGIIVEQDAGTFLRFSVHSAYEQTNVFVATIFGASATINVNQGIRGGAAIWMRVKRTGSNWSFTYSYDSIRWTPAFTFEQTMQVARIGPYAGNAQNSGAPAPAFTAIVDHWVNRASPPSFIDGSSYPPAPAPPAINVWYGDTQTFGQVGVPQQWVNVLGDVSDFNEVNTLTYTLNGGTPQPLWMGENIRRLVAPGNFNVEIDYASLNPGANTVTITATDNNGLQSSHSVKVNYVTGQNWPLPYTINWSTASSIQNVAQIVDGIWAIQSNGTVRTLQTGYDRILDLGDHSAWQNYVATAEVTMNWLNPNGFAVGFVTGWQGHTTLQYGQLLPDQPRTGHPFPGDGVYTAGIGPAALVIGENTVSNPETVIAQDTSGLTLSLSVKYIFKFQVQPNSSGGSHYSFKVWPASGSEPANWNLQADGELGLGSVILLAHECDISFGTVTVTGL